MTRIFTLFLFISLAWGQDEWIYYNGADGSFRVKPDYSEFELFMDSLSLLDISEDQETFLFRDNYNIYYIL